MTRRRKGHPSAALALRTAEAGGMTVEAVLTGILSQAGRCQACGSRIEMGAARAAGSAL